MAFSATFAMEMWLLSETDHTCLLKLFSRAELIVDHELFDNTAIEKGTAAILRTRDGQLRFAVLGPLIRQTSSTSSPLKVFSVH
jgi:3-dehydroquinate synthase